MGAIKRSNSRSVSNASKIHKFMIAPTDFSLDGGELTPTLKVKILSSKTEKLSQKLVELVAPELEDLMKLSKHFTSKELIIR